MTIIRNIAAPAVVHLGVRLTHSQVKRLEEGGLTPICSTDQDNEREHWFITDGGQLLRRTGRKLERAVLFSEEEAFEQLDAIATQEALLRAWSEDEIAAFRRPRPIPLSHD